VTEQPVGAPALIDQVTAAYRAKYANQPSLLVRAVRQAQYDAVCSWGIPDHAKLQRLAAIEQPAFVANGDGDPMIPPRYSHLIAGLLPHATVKIYPDAAHGFLFQHHAEFAADVTEFLG
jgi:pimeloyl-ACP methyl ester carboxylesterase